MKKSAGGLQRLLGGFEFVERVECGGVGGFEADEGVACGELRKGVGHGGRKEGEKEGRKK